MYLQNDMLGYFIIFIRVFQFAETIISGFLLLVQSYIRGSNFAGSKTHARENARRVGTKYRSFYTPNQKCHK